MNFLKRTEWHRRPASTVVDEQGCTNRLAALEQLRTRLRTRHYSYRTECTYVDWVRRFLDYAAQQQGVPHPRVASEVVRDYLAHLAVRQQVSASTQNQAFCAVLFLCREVLGVAVLGEHPGVTVHAMDAIGIASTNRNTSWRSNLIHARRVHQCMVSPRGSTHAVSRLRRVPPSVAACHQPSRRRTQTADDPSAANRIPRRRAATRR